GSPCAARRSHHRIRSPDGRSRRETGEGRLADYDRRFRSRPPALPRRQAANVWSIRSKLQAEEQTRDLAMFNLAIDSKLRACDVVALKVDDVAPNGYAADRATIRQRKTAQTVRFELTEQTRQSVDEHLRAAGKKPGDFMFSGRKGSDGSMTTRQYARLVSEW